MAALAVLPASAQTAWPRGENNSLQTSRVALSSLPAQVEDICFLDGKLHLLSDGMLFGVDINNGRLGSPEIDTALLAIDEQMTYAVRHPETGVLYYTKRDKKGVSLLYEYYEKKPGKYDTRRVKPYGFSFSVEHPVFSPDGRAMVFASDCPVGFGGKDLWYSEWRGGEWQYPQNLGHRINGEGDETMPALYGDFLVFASSGRRDSYGGSDLYASRLVALEQSGDTVAMYPIGRSAVQSLEAPFCTVGDDCGFTCDGNGNGWWLSRDDAGNEVFHSFSGRMDCIRLTGTVSNVKGAPLAGAEVMITSPKNKESKTLTDGEGRYTLFLQPGQEYELVCAASEHFEWNQTVSYLPTKSDRLYIDFSENIVLDAFEIDSIYSFADLYLSPVATELSPLGRKHLDRIVLFMQQNPTLHLNLSSAYNLSNDAFFCQLLNKARLRAITSYLDSKGIPASAISTSTSAPAVSAPDSAADSEEQNDETSLSEAAQSSLTVCFSLSR